MTYKKTYNPCDECNYSYSKNNEESNMCKICEFQELVEKSDIGKVLKQFYTIIEELGDKLEHYEILEEQGRLIELPCAVGDTVYDIAGKEIRKQIVDGVEYTKDGFFIYANEDEWIGMFGDLVFLTKEEAEAKLKELRGEQE